MKLVLKIFNYLLRKTIGFNDNQFHPLVKINGNPIIGKNVFIGFLSEINSKYNNVTIGDNCDIASFVSINEADSSLKCIGKLDYIKRNKIVLENNVFVGSHSFIGGDTYIGHHSVIAAGTILINGGYIPPYSLIIGNPYVVKENYFKI